MSNISPSTLEMLNQQIADEGLNSQKYAYIGAYLKNKGLNNIGAHFLPKQVDEERKHQDQIREYIIQRNEHVCSYLIPEFKMELTGVLQIAQFYLATEQQTTARLKAIAQAAFAEGDLLTFHFLQHMLDDQLHEEDEAITFLDKATMADDAPEVLLLWDANFSL
jgi:ferritin